MHEIDRFKEIKEYARRRCIPVIRGGPAEMLYNAVKESRPERMLEVGTAIGYSGLIMLSAHPEARLHTIEIRQDYADEAAANFERYGFGDRAEIYLGDAGELLKSFAGKFDFIFLDGPKTKYPVYFEALAALLEQGGTLFADNVFWGGGAKGGTAAPKSKKTITEGVRKYIELVTNDARFETRVFEAGDGVAVSKKL